MKILKFDSKEMNLIWGSEDWLISAHSNGMAVEKTTMKTLKELFDTKPELFGNLDVKEFPLLMKVIDAKTPLSIQVHPGDVYAKEHENSLGKTECWYILDCDNTDIIVGQNAKNREELSNAIANDDIESMLNIIDIKKDDFFYIPAGTVHAIRSNTKILEIQQSSDITYRLYDYKRTDAEGNERELHVEKSLDVIDYDYKYNGNNFEVRDNVEVLVESEFFNVYKATVADSFTFSEEVPFVIAYVLEGELNVNGEKCITGESYLIPNKVNMDITGNGKVIYSFIK